MTEADLQAENTKLRARVKELENDRSEERSLRARNWCLVEELQKTNQRLADLVRYKWHNLLHNDDLISNEEYAEIVQNPGAVNRLDGYDAAKAKFKAERDQLQRRLDSLRNQRGDDLCWLTDQDDHAEMIQALPQAEVEESCRRYQAQMRSERGVFAGGRTIAQLEVLVGEQEQRLAEQAGEIARWREEFKDSDPESAQIASCNHGAQEMIRVILELDNPGVIGNPDAQAIKEKLIAERKHTAHWEEARAIIVDLIDASQDPRCGDLRIVVKRAQAILDRFSTPASSSLSGPVDGCMCDEYGADLCVLHQTGADALAQGSGEPKPEVRTLSIRQKLMMAYADNEATQKCVDELVVKIAATNNWSARLEYWIDVLRGELEDQKCMRMVEREQRAKAIHQNIVNLTALRDKVAYGITAECTLSLIDSLLVNKPEPKPEPVVATRYCQCVEPSCYSGLCTQCGGAQPSPTADPDAKGDGE